MTELDHHNRRGGGQYSEGHRRMYTTIAEILGKRQARILEVGFGIGYGLEQLLAQRCVDKYLGIEIEKDCCEFVAKNNGHDNVKLINADWLTVKAEDLAFLGKSADFTLAIEVIEHIEKPYWVPFLNRLRDYTGEALFVSTPNKRTAPGHGVLTPLELTHLLYGAGFHCVGHVEWQWTTLYICNP